MENEITMEKCYEDYCELRTDLEIMLNAYDKKLMTWQKIRRNLNKFLDTHPILPCEESTLMSVSETEEAMACGT